MLRSITSSSLILASLLLLAPGVQPQASAQIGIQPALQPAPQTAAKNTTPPPKVGFSIIKTSQIAVRENLLNPNGSMFNKINSNFSAFLIKHGEDSFLFDTGMGSQIDQQYAQDMRWWQRPFFGYDHPVVPASAQLAKAGYAPVKQVILSHSHWDHAGGVADFPAANISITPEEMRQIRNPTTGAGGTWASQVAASAIQWKTLEFKPVPYQGYAQSLDLYNDGSIVLVPMPGHTPGSVGMFVTVDSGKVYFFIGDVAWTVEALKAGAAKFWAAGMIVDHEAEQTRRSVNQVRALLVKNPGLVVVPAHDSAVQDKLGYFPAWVR